MDENKNYIINIPDMINKQDAHKADYLKGFGMISGKYVKENEIPLSWLEEIEEEPVSAENWVDSKNLVTYFQHCESHEDQAIEIFKAGEQNQKLIYKPLIDLLSEWGTSTNGYTGSLWHSVRELLKELDISSKSET